MIVQDKFCPFQTEEVDAIATLYEDFGSQLVCQPTSRPSQPFPFLRLPGELQDMILAHTDIVSPAYHAASPLLAQFDPPEAFPCCRQCDQGDVTSECYCKNNFCRDGYDFPIRYSSTCICLPWKSPVLAVSKHLHALSLDLYYRQNLHVFWGHVISLTRQLERISVSVRHELRKIHIILFPTSTSQLWTLQPGLAHHVVGLSPLETSLDLPNVLYPFLTWIRERLLVSRLKMQIHLVRNFYFLEKGLVELKDNVQKEELGGCIKATAGVLKTATSFSTDLGIAVYLLLANIFTLWLRGHTTILIHSSFFHAVPTR